jgi:CHAD domain-containing protein
MQRTLEECDRAAAGFAAGPVHDLRVSLRRCRSMADGMMAMDPDPAWIAMKKAGKRLFQRLGALRDVQIMMEWIDRLDLADIKSEQAGAEQTPQASDAKRTDEIESSAAAVHAAPAPEPDHPAHALLHILKSREIEQKREARVALEEFNRKQWKRWAISLPALASRIHPGSAVFKHLALERWTAARALHTAALRNRSQISFHALRIGIKRFRYIVENFLPAEHLAWSNDLKHVQDLLGEVHDLDVLWATAVACHIFPDAVSRQTWHERILKERAKRIEEYREKTVGPDSWWNVWRAGLPQGKEIQQIATRRVKLWAKVLDPDFAHAERVAGLSLQLYDGLVKTGMLRMEPEVQGSDNGATSDARDCLYVAALLHDVGKSAGAKGHHKKSQALIKKHGTPLGWKPENMARAAIVARFHTGALPARRHKALRDLPPGEQKIIIRLVAILRLANALDSAHDGRIRSIRIENTAGTARRPNGFLRKPTLLGKNEALVVTAEGYSDGTPAAQTIAAERYLLETVLRRPVIVKPASSSRPPTSSGHRSNSHRQFPQ